MSRYTITAETLRAADALRVQERASMRLREPHVVQILVQSPEHARRDTLLGTRASD
jgi:hypothetical protein